MFSMPVPKFLGDKEIIVFELSRERFRRDIVDGLSSIEIIVVSLWFGHASFPGGVVGISMEHVFGISPGLVKTFDGLDILLLTHGKNKVVVANDSTISQDDFIVIRVDSIDSNIFGMGVVLADALFCSDGHIEFD